MDRVYCTQLDNNMLVHVNIVLNIWMYFKTVTGFIFFAVSQQTQHPQVNDEDVSRLQEMFPTLDTEVVRSVLEANNGMADSAVTALLQMTETWTLSQNDRHKDNTVITVFLILWLYMYMYL